MLACSRNKRVTAVLLPNGIIIPYNSAAAVPAGWDAWTTANAKHIVGAGSTYAVGANSAAGTALSKATNTSGAHSGGILNNIDNGGGNYHDGGNAGDHSHTLGMTYTPAYRQMILIKANTTNAQFPINGVVFGKSDLSSFVTNILSGDNKILRAGASAANGAAAVSVDSVSVAGAHVHGNASGTNTEQWGDYCSPTVSAGGHNDHSCTAALNTDAVKKAILTAWTDASVAFSAAAGMIAMYENTTPPSGWYLCDGNNGTMDLRDYFIYIGTTANHGTSSGNNTVTVDITIGSSNWVHDHSTNNQKVPGANVAQHPSGTFAHAHDGTITGSSHAFVPVYYALAFIQKG